MPELRASNGVTQQNARDIQELKEKGVTREQFAEFREDILRRLKRIEDKIDEETLALDKRKRGE